MWLPIGKTIYSPLLKLYDSELRNSSLRILKNFSFGYTFVLFWNVAKRQPNHRKTHLYCSSLTRLLGINNFIANMAMCLPLGCILFPIVGKEKEKDFKSDFRSFVFQWILPWGKTLHADRMTLRNTLYPCVIVSLSRNSPFFLTVTL